MTRPQPPLMPRPGQAIGLAAPAAAFDPDALERGLEALAGLVPGLAPRRDPEIMERAGYLAGADALRAEHLTRLMTEPGLGAVLCARGGYGSSRLLPLLDLKRLAAGRRLLVGFSDLTCILLPLAAHGLVTVHGPVVTQVPRLDQASREDLAALLAGAPSWPAVLAGRPLAPGRARGPLLGGNLTLICHLLGTPYLPPLDGAVLLLEEISEKAYRVDRLLTQLILAGVTGRIAGVALGSLAGEGGDREAVMASAAERLSGLGLPVVSGLPVGHGAANRCLPLGAMAEIDGDAGTLTVGLGLA